MTSFYLWWVAEKGQPPATREERDLFDVCCKAWKASRRVNDYKEVRAQIEDRNPEAIFFEDPTYESALVGMTHDGRAVYDQNLCIEYLIEQDDGELDPEQCWEQAADFFSYNTLRALDYIDAKNRPVIIDTEL